MGGAQKGSLYQFFPVISINVGIGLQNLRTFNFNPFATLIENFKAISSASLKIFELEPRPPLQKVFLLVKFL